MEWIECTLGEICDIGGGEVKTGPFGSQLHQSDYEDEGIPVVMPKDIIDGRVLEDSIARVNDGHIERLSQHKLSEGDIVYGRRGDIGRQALVRIENAGWLCGTGCLRVTLGKNSAVSSRFLHLYLKQPDVITWIANQAIGATMPNLNTSILRSVPVKYPSNYSYQDQLADKIFAYGNLIENNTRRIAVLEDMAQSLYREWFVKFRFPGHEDSQFKDSSLGKIPEGWEVKLFSELVDYKTGKLNSNAAVETGDYPFFTCSQETFRTNTWSFDCECVLLGGNNANAIYPIKYFEGKFDAYQRTYVITEKNRDQITPAYLYFSLLLKLTHLKNISTGSATRFLTKGILDNLEFIVPPPSLMSDFNSMGLSALKLKNSIVKKNEAIRKQRDMLLPKIISGRIEV